MPWRRSRFRRSRARSPRRRAPQPLVFDDQGRRSRTGQVDADPHDGVVLLLSPEQRAVCCVSTAERSSGNRPGLATDTQAYRNDARAFDRSAAKAHCWSQVQTERAALAIRSLGYGASGSTSPFIEPEPSAVLRASSTSVSLLAPAIAGSASRAAPFQY